MMDELNRKVARTKENNRTTRKKAITNYKDAELSEEQEDFENCEM